MPGNEKFAEAMKLAADMRAMGHRLRYYQADVSTAAILSSALIDMQSAISVYADKYRALLEQMLDEIDESSNVAGTHLPDRIKKGNTGMVKDEVESPQRNRALIDVNQSSELSEWATALGVTENRLEHVVRAVGPTLEVVRRHLGRAG